MLYIITLLPNDNFVLIDFGHGDQSARSERNLPNRYYSAQVFERCEANTGGKVLTWWDRSPTLLGFLGTVTLNRHHINRAWSGLFIINQPGSSFQMYLMSGGFPYGVECALHTGVMVFGVASRGTFKILYLFYFDRAL